MSGLNIAMAKAFLEPEEVAALENVDTPVRQRAALQNKGFWDFDLETSNSNVRGRIYELLSEHDAQVPEYMVDNPKRKQRWEWAFQAPVFKGGRLANLRRATEIALDNMLKHVVIEQLKDKSWGRYTPQEFQEAITSTSVDPFITQALPLVRRIVPQIIYRSLFRVIPTSQPDTKVFSLKRFYGDTHEPSAGPGVAAGVEVWPYIATQRDRFYSGGRVIGEAVGAGTGAQTDYDLGYDGTANHTFYLDGVETSNFTISAGTGTANVDEVSFGVAPLGGVVITSTYDNQTEGTRGRDIDITIRGTTINGEDLKLRAAWTDVLAQNAMAYHSINLDNEFTQAMAEEIVQDLEAIVLNDVLARAGAGDVGFDATAYLTGDTSTFERRQYQKGIWDTFIEASQNIYEFHRQWPTWICAGMDLSQKLMQLENFSISASPQKGSGMTSTDQRTELGTIGNRWVLYQNPYLPPNRGVLGFLAPQPFDIGYAITMFLPFFATPTLNASDASFNKAKGVMYRGGREMIESTHYSTVTIANL